MKITNKRIERYDKLLKQYYVTGDNTAIKKSLGEKELVLILNETKKFLKTCPKKNKTESIMVIISSLLVCGSTVEELRKQLDEELIAGLFGGLRKVLSNVSNHLPYFSEKDGKEFFLICTCNFNVSYSLYSRVVLKEIEIIMTDASKFEALLLGDIKNFILVSMSNGQLTYDDLNHINRLLICSKDRMQRAFGFYFIFEKIEASGSAGKKNIEEIINESIIVLEQGDPQSIADLFFQYFSYKKWNHIYEIYGQMALSSKYQEYFNKCLAESPDISLEMLSSIVLFIDSIPVMDIYGNRIKLQQIKRAIANSLITIIENRKCGTQGQDLIRNILDFLSKKLIISIKKKTESLKNSLFDSELDEAIRYPLYIRDIETSKVIQEICAYNR